MTYRENSAPASPTRPVLTRWQRVVVAVLRDRLCANFAWYRAHIGGAWCYGARHEVAAEWRWRWVPLPFNECPVLHFAPASIACRCKRDACRCEVYPWPSLYENQKPENARNFEEFREWYDRAQVAFLRGRER